MDDVNQDNLDELQDELVEEAEEKQQQTMKIDNRSIFTVKDTIIKKSDQPDKPKNQ